MSTIAVGAIFLSNIPEGRSSAAAGTVAPLRLRAMVRGDRTPGSRRSPWLRYSWRIISGFIAATTAIAAGAILAMLADTMIPETESAHDFAGRITVLGFLLAFAMSKLAGQ